MGYSTATVTITFGPWSVGVAQDTVSNGKPIITVWKTGDPNFPTGPVTITLGTLSIANNKFVKGTPRTEPILGYTAGSTITATGLPAGLTIDNVNHQLIWDGSSYTGTGEDGTFTPTETLAGATNTPKVGSALAYQVGVRPFFSANPSISPTTAVVGAALTGADGTYAGYPAPTFVSRNFYSGVATLSTTNSYTIQSSDIGNNIGYEVQITNAYDTVTGFSATIGPVTAGTGLSTPTFALYSAPGTAPVQFTASSPDYTQGMFGQIQFASDSAFTTITQDTLAQFITADDWARLTASFGFSDPAGTYYARFRLLRDNDSGTTTVGLPSGGSSTFDASPWSNTVTDTINVSVAALTTTAGTSKSAEIDVVSGTSNRGWAHNNNDGALSMIRADRAAGSNFTQWAARIDAYYSGGGTQFHAGCIDGTRALNVAGTVNYPGKGASGTFYKGFTVEVYSGDTHLGLYYNGTTASWVVPFAMHTKDIVIWTLNKTTKVVNFYVYQDPSNGANGISGLIGTITVDANHTPADDWFFFGAGQKGSAGSPTTSDAGTFIPSSATNRTYDSGCNDYG